jgi:hypothetical protein
MYCLPFVRGDFYKAGQLVFCQSVDVCTVANRVANNGLRIADGWAFEKRQPNLCTNAQ